MKWPRITLNILGLAFTRNGDLRKSAPDKVVSQKRDALWPYPLRIVRNDQKKSHSSRARINYAPRYIRSLFEAKKKNQRMSGSALKDIADDSIYAGTR